MLLFIFFLGAVFFMVPTRHTAKELYEKQLLAKKKETPSSKSLAFLVAVAVLLLIIVWVLIVFLPNQYRFSFTADGNICKSSVLGLLGDPNCFYYSNDYTPTEFFKAARDENNFIVSVDLIDGNSDPWAVNSMNLWLVELNSKKKHTVLLIKSVDSFGNIASCLSNDGNVLVSREISGQECSSLLGDASKIRINLHFSGDNKVVFSANQADIFAQKGRTMSTVNYILIKGIDANFDRTLAIINETIGSIN
jgi:hypothetical protein